MKLFIPFALVGVVLAGSTGTQSENSLEILGTSLGLAGLAGINLYLTVLVTGIAIHFGWLTHYPAGLGVLAEPGIITLAAVLYTLEFFADKVPWVDSLWDTVHTFIRPIGGAFLAIRVLGTTDPMLDVVAGLLGGSVAFSTHSTKAGTRLLVNHSPEPVSNWTVSVAEDVGVLGGAYLAFQHPVLTLALLCVFLTAFIYFGPKLVRMLKAEFVWVGGRIASWLGRERKGRLKNQHQEVVDSLPARFAEKALQLIDREERLTFALPCFSGRMPRVGRFTRGVVVGTNAGRLWYLGRKNFRIRSKLVPFVGTSVEFRKRFLFDEVLIRTTGPDGMIGLRFSKQATALTTELVDWLRARSARVETPAEELAMAEQLADPTVG